MTNLFPFLGYLLTFLTTGSSLTCKQCITINGTNCKGISRKCPPSATSCIRSLEVTTIGNQTVVGFKRTCTDDPRICDQHFVMVGGLQEKQIKTDCCKKDECNKCRSKNSSMLKFSLMGCITPGGCALGPKIIPGAKIVEAKRLSCTKAKKIIQ